MVLRLRSPLPPPLNNSRLEFIGLLLLLLPMRMLSEVVESILLMLLLPLGMDGPEEITLSMFRDMP